MTYKRTVPTAYAVFFEHGRVLKVGISGQQRWRNWLARGARLVGTVEFADVTDARLFEEASHQFLRSHLERAFASREDQTAFTGIVGGGWTEFYRVPSDINPEEVLREIDKHRDNSGITKSAELVTRTDGRTNGRMTHLPESSFSSVTRTRNDRKLVLS